MKKLIAALTSWYKANNRELIWRKTQDPYSIWVSEIMAQQTRITTVLPYYERFIERFPTVGALSNSSIDGVLKAWEGLGYYSRAHNLFKTAKIIMEQYNGHFPETLELLRALPGIGDYTAGAIASICFNQPAPAVDGNVLRVFARLDNNEADINASATKKLLTAHIKAMLAHAEPGILNQAIMELGALVCIPKNPLCGECPAALLCKAFRTGTQNRLPVKGAKKEQRKLEKTVVLLINSQKEVLMRQRDERLLKGLWEFYTVEGSLSTGKLKAHLRRIPCAIRTITPIGDATHTFTHIRWHMRGYACLTGDITPPEGYRFIQTDEIQNFALPTAIDFYKKWLLTEKNTLRILGA